MLEVLRKYKLSYALYNLFQYKYLKHNLELYKKYGINKFYFSSISSADFPSERKLPGAELDKIIEDPVFKALDEQHQKSIQEFNDNGYVILKNFLSHDQVDQINQDVERILNTGKSKFRYGGKKLMFAFHQSDIIKKIAFDNRLTRILGFLVGGEVNLFQSINFVNSGSEQKTHSDSVHMTTYPLGGLLGVWVALEDIDDDNGPLSYYPGSHKLPYYLNKDFGNEGTKYKLGKKDYSAYEQMIQEKLETKFQNKKIFKARKGDVLIWHANLFHGGEPHLNPEKTRKSMVFHYFKKDVICYHEITQRPALIKN